mmetsp:Transcript_4386/g.7784  ORF Transcript_4386/g.7784 Transcript_4386/m.7784 type:complete len:112 (-) Transcript_4386:90-425(-)|eukprot:CAMPEP_0197661314 /NCGR_PEP_ID=MMETSP1338-20131121/51385_1 /TAXON_ID=43686 ORGANISM="Pelagodinium beii, Strain RCC1491" /NCGR_SAMPLE_ID=MMETSP1338 /ASSEMBLY_ACC=CAM_ASM_000754 /LENGTH=111 /DNA_ID=CAMNT_0043238851 /DNA_START=112 /DNA_END=447 /DNA_ORIENTATION=+
MVGVFELFVMLKNGSIDFVGQKQAFDLQFYVLWTSGVIGFVHGFIMSSFLYTFYWVFGAGCLMTALCLPAWPLWNRNPVNWQEPQVEEEEDAPKPKESKKSSSKNSGKKKN